MGVKDRQFVIVRPVDDVNLVVHRVVGGARKALVGVDLRNNFRYSTGGDVHETNGRFAISVTAKRIQ